MGIERRDLVTGEMTTGHEWNGIKELNTPVPRVLWAFLITLTAFAVLWTVLMPSWPGINGYFRGLLGADQRVAVNQSVEEAKAERATWTSRIDSEDFAAIQADEELMTIVRQTGAALFGDNCAACHGTDAQGRPGFPNLIAAPIMWGDDPEVVAEAIFSGIDQNKFYIFAPPLAKDQPNRAWIQTRMDNIVEERYPVFAGKNWPV